MAAKGSRRSRRFALYASEVRLSLRINSGAYGFSVMITSTMAMLTTAHATPTPGQIFLFLIGAVASFAAIETLITRGFARRPKDRERPEVVALGSSLSLISIGGAVGVVWLLGQIIPEPGIWIIAPFCASLTYVLVLGVEMTVARRIEEGRNVQ